MITVIKIDKGIPVPADLERRNARKYPFNTMEVGDSFFVTEGFTAARNSAYTYKKQNPGWDFTWAHEGDGCRIWRTS